MPSTQRSPASCLDPSSGHRSKGTLDQRPWLRPDPDDPTPAQTPRYPGPLKRLKRSVTTLPPKKQALLVVLLLLIGLFSYQGVQLYADEMAQRTEFELVVLRLLGGGENYLDVELELDIHNPSGFNIQTRYALIEIFYENESAGYLDLPALRLRPGHNDVEFATRMTDSGQGRLELMAQRMLAGETADLALKGTVRTRKPLSLELDLDKRLSLGGLGGLEIEVHHIGLDLSDPTGMDALVRLTIFNPSRIEVDLDLLAFDILYRDKLLTTFDPDGFLLRGENLMELDIHVPASADDIYNPLAQGLIDGQPADFHIRTNVSGDNLLSRVAATYTHDYTMGEGGPGGGDGFNTSVTGIGVAGIGLFQSRVTIAALLDNPGTLSTDLAPLTFSVYYRDSHVGDLDLDRTAISPGLNHLTMSMTVSTLSLNTLSMVTRLVTGQAIDLTITATRAFDTRHALVFTLPITVNEDTPAIL